MKVFLSYCENNGGLDFAKKSTIILEKYDHTAWYFDRDKTLGAPRPVDIAQHVRKWCDVVFFICTNGSIYSDGQMKEIAHADKAGKLLIVFPIDNPVIPWEIDTNEYFKLTGSNFEQEFKKIAENLVEIVEKFLRLKWSVRARYQSDKVSEAELVEKNIKGLKT